MTDRNIKLWFLVLPVLALFYVGLLVTIQIWYPEGLDARSYEQHLTNFSVIYVFWLISFFIYTLFDLKTFQKFTVVIARLVAAMVTNALIAISYFYFQPELILTPRRFLLVHLFITFVCLLLWYGLAQRILLRLWKKNLYLHEHLYTQSLHNKVEQLLRSNQTLGWKLAGRFDQVATGLETKATLLLPALNQLPKEEVTSLFKFKQQGWEFIEYRKFYEQAERTIQLEYLDEVWFLKSVNYRDKRGYEIIKRLIDVVVGLVGVIILLLLLPVLAVIIKLDSRGSVFFVQPRVGRNGHVFNLIKLRTMSGGVTNTWTTQRDQRITRVGRWLRKFGLDELPQFFNILKGDMSLVGPRPEQVHIVERLIEEISYYNERHIVKPGLTGWSQIHIYAASVEESKQKLQYDLYYIKHRSLILDLEIVLRTVFHFLTMQSR